jgi:hypothetical protein
MAGQPAAAHNCLAGQKNGARVARIEQIFADLIYL